MYDVEPCGGGGGPGVVGSEADCVRSEVVCVGNEVDGGVWSCRVELDSREALAE